MWYVTPYGVCGSFPYDGDRFTVARYRIRAVPMGAGQNAGTYATGPLPGYPAERGRGYRSSGHMTPVAWSWCTLLIQNTAGGRWRKVVGRGDDEAEVRKRGQDPKCDAPGTDPKVGRGRSGFWFLTPFSSVTGPNS